MSWFSRAQSYTCEELDLARARVAIYGAGRVTEKLIHIKDGNEQAVVDDMLKSINGALFARLMDDKSKGQTSSRISFSIR